MASMLLEEILGFPITPDALQTNSDGSDFLVLSRDAEQLTHASYFGGRNQEEGVNT